MNKIQKPSFQSVNEFLDYLPENELMLTEELRRLIFECIPEVKEKLSYNVPFYSGNKRICFIWPSSIPWGNVPEEAVTLGFTSGHLIPDPFDLLQKGKRKFVRTLSFFSLDEIDVAKVQFYLFEALNID